MGLMPFLILFLHLCATVVGDTNVTLMVVFDDHTETEAELSCSSARIHLHVLRNVSCSGNEDGQVSVQVTGGVPPFIYEISRGRMEEGGYIVSGVGFLQVNVVDSQGCTGSAEIEVLYAPPFLAVIYNTHFAERSWLSYDVNVVPMNGVPPFFAIWNHFSMLDDHYLSNVPAGAYTVLLQDHNNCFSRASTLISDESELESCPQLSDCLVKRNFHASYYIQCLRKAAAPLLWDSKNWSLCAARAALEIAKRIHRSPQEGEEFGAASVALLIAEALLQCELNFGSPQCNFPWNLLKPFFFDNEQLWAAFYSRNFTQCWWIMSGLNRKDWSVSDVLIADPLGFKNEPVFGPSLVAPFGISVVVLIPHMYHFPTSLLRLAVFPWTLQVDVELTAIFVKQLMLLLQPKWVLPSDEGGILALAKLGSRVREGIDFPFLVDCFKRSMTWPVVYPPPNLSKLVPGHELFAPKESVVSQDDGMRITSLNMQDVVENFCSFNSTKGVILKREYSENSRGVRWVSQESRIAEKVHALLKRQDGIGYMDLDLKVRLFFQARVQPTGNIGVRFIAQQGRILAMSLSLVLEVRQEVALEYVTTRKPIVEERAAAFLREINYTGFGATWWWQGHSDDEWFLIDFNARIERHACLGPVLPKSEKVNDPCYLFQELLRNNGTLNDIDGKRVPKVVSSGYEYRDPIRITKKLSRDMDLCNTNLWNVNSFDVDLYENILDTAGCQRLRETK